MDEHAILEGHQFQDFETTDEFEGEKHGMSVSFIIVDTQPGSGVRLHRHPYPEIFIVQEAEPRTPSARRPWK